MSAPAPAPAPGHWRDRPVLVTGATGLLGGWVVQRLLAAGARPVCLVRDQAPRSLFARRGLADRVDIARGDVCDQALLERVLGEYEVRTVLHLAAQTIVGIAQRNPVSTFETNIAGTWRLLEACRRSPLVQAVVVASSDKAYGAHADPPTAEGAPLRAVHPYDASKACADLLAQTYAHSWGLPVAVTRCGNFFGPGDLNWSRLVPGTVRSLLRGEAPVLRSDGSHVRDYLYVEDGAEACLLLARALAGDPGLHARPYNFSYENRLTVRQVVDLVQRRMGAGIEPEILGTATHEIPHQHLSAARARRDLGWRPRFDMAAGLDRTIAWYRDLLVEG